MIELTYIKCSGKKCTSIIGVLNPIPGKKEYCQRACAGKKDVFVVMKKTPKMPPVKTPRPRKRVVKVDRSALYEERRNILKIIKEDSGMNLTELGKAIGTDHASVSRYLNGETNITDKRWEIVERAIK